MWVASTAATAVNDIHGGVERAIFYPDRLYPTVCISKVETSASIVAARTGESAPFVTARSGDR
jgi:hypothetical protein